MLARLGLAQGPVTVAANQGRYNLDQQKVDGRRARSRCRSRRLAARDARCHGGLQAAHGERRRRVRAGWSSASSRPARLRADLDEPNGRPRRRRSLENRARGSQMRRMRRPALILASRLLRLPAAAAALAQQSQEPFRRSRATTATRRSTLRPTGSKCRTAPTGRSSSAMSM